MSVDLDTIREAVAEVLRHDEAATPGPWRAEHDCLSGPDGWVAECFDTGSSVAAAAHFRTAAPALARAVERLAGALDEVRARVRQAGTDHHALTTAEEALRDVARDLREVRR